jgi:hypothetical protein
LSRPPSGDSGTLARLRGLPWTIDEGSPVTATLHYDVENLFVRRDQLGSVLRGNRDGLPVEIEVPSAEGRAGRFAKHPPALTAALNGDPFGTEALSGHHWGDDHIENPPIGVRVLQVRVDLGRGLADAGPSDPDLRLLRDADDTCSKVVRALLDWARVEEGQVELSPAHVRPQLVTGRGVAWLEDRTGRRQDCWAIRSQVAVGLHPGAVERMGNIAAVPEALLSGLASLPVGEALLVEAQRAVWPSYDADPQRAVLLAAIALEVKTPAALRAASRNEQRSLLELLLARHDEVPTSVRFQLNAVADLVFGESLKRHDGRLDTRIKSAFDLRNDIAHRGDTPTVDAARDAISAVRETFGWLDEQVHKNRH